MSATRRGLKARRPSSPIESSAPPATIRPPPAISSPARRSASADGGRNVGGGKNMGGSSVAKPALRSLSVAPLSAPVVRRVDMKDLHGFDRDPVKDLVRIPTERDDSRASHVV